jgi:type I restriction enzyme S subunit
VTWPQVALGEICQLKYGKSLKADARSTGSVPVMGSNGPVGSHDESLTSGPTVVVGRKGSIGAVAYSHVSSWPIDTTYYVDATSTSQDLRWLYWRLQKLGLERMNKSAAVPGLNREDAHRVRLTLPPLPEQRRIASILDQADELRAKRRKSLLLLDAFADAAFVDAFRDGHAEALKLGDIAQIKSGSTPDRSEPTFFGGDIPWVKTGEVRGGWIAKTEETVTEAGRKAARLQIHPIGSIVIAMYGQGKTRGQSGLLAIEATVNQACAVVWPSNRFLPQFMAHQIHTKYDELRSKAQGGNQANLNLGLVGDLDVQVPPLEKQQGFVEQATRLQKLRDHHQAHLNKLDELFASLQHRAFRGEL